MNALADARVVEYMNENFVCTYLKVGTFQIVNGQKQGGNVASYFCFPDKSVVHAVPGQVTADKLLSEARWAYEMRKTAITHATDVAKDIVDARKMRDLLSRAHAERYHAEQNNWNGKKSYVPVPGNMPKHVSQQSQAHWLLARQPMGNLDNIYPFVWTQILREDLSTGPVAKR